MTPEDVQAAAKIAAEFAEIPFANHEARVLALAYLELQAANQWLRDDLVVKVESLADETARAEKAEREAAYLNREINLNRRVMQDAGMWDDFCKHYAAYKNKRAVLSSYDAAKEQKENE